jgi:hypothetical protein
VINVPNRSHIHMRLRTVKLLLRHLASPDLSRPRWPRCNNVGRTTQILSNY